ncbi:uncharacterized protein TRUGW13939_00879 [Talaromyces rugulosus]|uniref:ER-bound oxygenase mpaB/mpaB'/Rubber oxygenase catalytic domain-containing protein n=1 Tax=Talaromyces rugulosus TaxID=121627 RepID=A0A7H8QIK4_TALRU|nr:uncharacterized protein TRUGW13939_00879 [Talaromyces rugulosus]QKX53799.1 hypothetical protein TRUGW13939_00879 [Talaromyces rugulosus]
MNTRTVGNYSFELGPLHIVSERMQELRQQHDTLGSETVIILQEIWKTETENSGQSTHRMDLYGILASHHTEDETLSKFWGQIHSVPEWVDWDQIKRGQKFFYRYALANLIGFALQGFMGENAASSGTAEVLIRTGGFSTRKLLGRLLETFQFLLQVTESEEAIKPGGVGHVTTVRVRLLHAMVHGRISNLEKVKPGYFDVEKFGKPINDFDCIHAISTFCCNHSWLQLPQMGVHPTYQETADYIALFRYVAYVIGTPDEYFADVARSKATMESMLLSLQINSTSRIMGHNFVQCLKDLPPVNISAEFIEAGCRVLNGDEFCDKLGLGKPGLYSYACFKGFCWFVRALAFLQCISPGLDRSLTNFFQRALHQGIIQSKSGLAGGTKFDFKYTPRIGQKVGKEDNNRLPPLFPRPVESFLFLVFAVGCLSPIAGLGLLFYLVKVW